MRNFVQSSIRSTFISLLLASMYMLTYNPTALLAQQITSDFNLTLPTNGATGVSLTPTFTWEAVSGTALYGIDITTADDTDFSNPVFSKGDIDGSTNSFTLTTSELSARTTYIWQVGALPNPPADPMDPVLPPQISNVHTFTTAGGGDTTPPSFENSTPSAASITATGFTLNTDIDEAGSIFYVVLADGATAPTSAEVIAGTGNGGATAVTSANATVSSGGFTNAFAVTGLSASTAYDVYVVARDDESTPNVQSSPTKVDVSTIAAADVTPPMFENSTPSINSVTSSGFTLNTDINEAGQIFYVVLADGATAPTSAEVIAGTGNGGATAVTSGNATVDSGTFSNAFGVTGLSAGTAYDVYVVARDDESTPNVQASPTKLEVSSSAAADVTPPTFENSTPSAASITATGFMLNTDIDEAGSIFYVVLADGATAPTSAEVIAGTGNGGATAVTSANATVSSGGFTNAFAVTGLSASTAYDVYVVARDDESTPNVQSSPTKVDVSTISAAPVISNLVLGKVEGNISFSFQSSKILGTNGTAADLANNNLANIDIFAAITGPGLTNPPLGLYPGDFTRSGSGPYTYSLSKVVAYPQGGSYTASIQQAKDPEGNEGIDQQNPPSVSYTNRTLSLAIIQAQTKAIPGGTYRIEFELKDQADVIQTDANGITWTKNVDGIADPVYNSTTEKWVYTQTIAEDRAAGAYAIDFTANRTGYESSTKQTTTTITGKPFITTWNVSGDNRIALYTHGPSTYDAIIDWGDGTVTILGSSNPDPVHTYATSGSKTVRIGGNFPHLRLGDPNESGVDVPIPYATNAQKLTGIIQWGEIAWESMEGMFEGATNLTTYGPNAGVPNLAGVSSMSKMFGGATAFNGDLSGWDVSGVTDFSFMFGGATSSSFTGTGLQTWQPSSALNMSYMFLRAAVFNTDISSWGSHLGNVTNMEGMFSGASVFNQNIGNWNVEKVTNMDFMFDQATAFSQDLTAWCTLTLSEAPLGFSDGSGLLPAQLPTWGSCANGFSVLENGVTVVCPDAELFSTGTISYGNPAVSTTFRKVNRDTLAVIAANASRWAELETVCTTGITAMDVLFTDKPTFNQNIAHWDVSSATTMEALFANASAFNQNLSAWDVSKVLNFNITFNGASSFNNGDVAGGHDQPLTWTPTSATDFNYMFSGANAFNQEIQSWAFTNVTNMTGMFRATEAFNNGGVPLSWTNQVTAVTGFNNMFDGARAFDQDISTWEVSEATQFRNFLDQSAFSRTNYDKLLQSWSTKLSSENGSLDASSSTYSVTSLTARNLLTRPVSEGGKGWTINDGGLVVDQLVLASTYGETVPEITLQDTLFFTLTGDGFALDDSFTFGWNNADGFTQNEGLNNATPFYVSEKAQWGVKVSEVFSGFANGNYSYKVVSQFANTISNTLEIPFSISTPLTKLQLQYEFVYTLNAGTREWLTADRPNEMLFTDQVYSFNYRVMKVVGEGEAQEILPLTAEEAEAVGRPAINGVASNPQTINNLTVSGNFPGHQGIAYVQLNEEVTEISDENRNQTITFSIGDPAQGFETDEVVFTFAQYAQKPLILGYSLGQSGLPVAPQFALESMGLSENGGGDFYVQWDEEPLLSSTNGKLIAPLSWILSGNKAKIWGVSLQGIRPADDNNRAALKEVISWGEVPLKSMRAMFSGATSLKLPTSAPSFIANVEDFTETFKNTQFADHGEEGVPVKSWNVSGSTTFSEFLSGSNLSTSDYSTLLRNYAELSFTSAASAETPLIFGADGIKYSFDRHLDRKKLIDEKFWSISDGGIDVTDRALQFTGAAAITDLTQPYSFQIDFGQIDAQEAFQSIGAVTNVYPISFAWTLVNAAGQTPEAFDTSAEAEPTFNSGDASWSFSANQLAFLGELPKDSYTLTLTATFGNGETISTSKAISYEDLPLFRFAANGYTVVCPDAQEGNTGVLNFTDPVDQSVRSVTFTKRGRDAIIDILSATEPNYDALETTCTSGITDMSELFRGKGANPTTSTFTDVSRWDVSSVTTMQKMFEATKSLTVDLSKWDVSNVEDMSFMFNESSDGQFKEVAMDEDEVSNGLIISRGVGDLSNWQVGSVKTMRAMFRKPRGVFLAQGLNAWGDRTANVTDMSEMFSENTFFDQDISSWDVSKVENMNYMFYKADAFNQDISSWEVGSVKAMAYMFTGSVVGSNFNQDISSWDVSNVENMDYMFFDNSVFDQDLSTWCVSKITSIPTRFKGRTISNESYKPGPKDPIWGFCPTGKLSIVDWSYGSGSDLKTKAGGGSYTACDEGGIEMPLSGDEGIVPSDLFFTLLNGDGQEIDGSQANQIIWELPSFLPIIDTPTSTYNSTTYNKVNGPVYENGRWKLNFVHRKKLNIIVRAKDNAGNLIGQASIDACEKEIQRRESRSSSFLSLPIKRPSNSPWGFFKESASSELTNTTEFVYGISYMKENSQGQLVRDTLRAIIYWGDGTVEDYIGLDYPTHTYAEDGEYLIAFKGNANKFEANPSQPVSKAMESRLANTDYALAYTDVYNWGDTQWVDLAEAFAGAENLSITAEDTLDLNRVESLKGLFRGAVTLDADLSSWDLSNVKNVSEMFRGAASFNGNVSTWNTANVTNMGGMFDGAQSFNQNVSEWDVSAVTQFDLEEDGQIVAGFLGNTAMSTENVDALLQSMSQQTLQPSVKTITTYPSQYSDAGASALNQLANDKGLTVTTGGQRTQVTVNQDLQVGWNLVSIPVIQSSNKVAAIFPWADPTKVYGFNGAYTEVDSLRAGLGYWVYADEARTLNWADFSLPPMVRNVRANWNLLGSNSFGLSLTDLVDPSGLLNKTTAQGYENGAYATVSSVNAGQAFWVQSSGAGQIDIPFNVPSSKTTQANFASKFAASGQMDLSFLTINIGDGRSAIPLKVGLSENGGVSAQNAEDRLLPPLPPEGAFDARFVINELGYRVKVLNSTLDSDQKMQMSYRNDQVTPIQLSWDESELLDGWAYYFESAEGANSFSVDLRSLNGVFIPSQEHSSLATSTVLVMRPETNTSIRDEEHLPSSLVLSQNYPNPFNPSTLISYSLPEPTQVRLEVFNMQGQRMAVLVNAIQTAGQHQFNYDASALPTGVYLYRITTPLGSMTQKMTLMK